MLGLAQFFALGVDWVIEDSLWYWRRIGFGFMVILISVIMSSWFLGKYLDRLIKRAEVAARMAELHRHREARAAQ